MTSSVEMKKREIYDLVKDAALKLYGLCPEFTVGRPKDRSNGDFAASAALVLGGVLRRYPAEIAAEIAAQIQIPDGEVRAMGKGFLNFFLSSDFLISVLEPVRELPELPMEDLNSPDFYPSYVYNRLKRMLELHGERPDGGENLSLLTDIRERRLLWAIAEENIGELLDGAVDFYDEIGLRCGYRPLWLARYVLMNNALYTIYCSIRKD
ncbi:MAG: hypothetical protein ACI4SS_00795 [Clostridia bacterium]